VKHYVCESVDVNGCRYMLLPALLGYFINKNTKLDRFDVVQKSQVTNISVLLSLNHCVC